MSYSQPSGYRLPSSASLPSISRALERFGWSAWRLEAVRATAQVAVELLEHPDDQEEVLRRLSGDQVGDDDLVISSAMGAGVLLRAAEFLDVAHAALSKPTAVPLPRALDLRCRAQFMDDAADPDRAWIYVLFGTEQASLQQIFEHLRGIEPYPVPPVGGVTIEEIVPDPDDLDLQQRTAVWERVLAPYARFSPLMISAPEPALAFDIIESLRAEDQDAALQDEGKVTVTAVVAAIAERLQDPDLDDIRARVVRAHRP